jgi:hypothetical protein
MHFDKHISLEIPRGVLYICIVMKAYIYTLCKLYIRTKLDASECVYSLSRNSIEQFQASVRGFISLKYIGESHIIIYITSIALLDAAATAVGYSIHRWWIAIDSSLFHVPGGPSESEHETNNGTSSSMHGC